ncbi:hypothetical protein ACHAXS_006431, partial [Conticribra weissflogii]
LQRFHCATNIPRQPHGRCFLVHEPQEFVDKVLSIYFGQTKIASFQRQLNMYGFLRLTKGRDKGCYYHELFLKHKLFLCQDIARISLKGTGVKIKVDRSSEPDFYSMPFVEPDPEVPRELIALSKEYENQHSTTKTSKKISLENTYPATTSPNSSSCSSARNRKPNTLIDRDQDFNAVAAVCDALRRSSTSNGPISDCSSPILDSSVDWNDLNKLSCLI